MRVSTGGSSLSCAVHRLPDTKTQKFQDAHNSLAMNLAVVVVLVVGMGGGGARPHHSALETADGP